MKHRLVGGPCDGGEIEPGAEDHPFPARIFVLMPGTDVGGAPVAASYLRNDETGTYGYTGHTFIDGTEGSGRLV